MVEDASELPKQSCLSPTPIYYDGLEDLVTVFATSAIKYRCKVKRCKADYPEPIKHAPLPSNRTCPMDYVRPGKGTHFIPAAPPVPKVTEQDYVHRLPVLPPVSCGDAIGGASGEGEEGAIQKHMFIRYT